MEMQKNLERIIAETSAVAIPVTAQPGEKEDWIVTATPMKVSRAITEIIWTPRPGHLYSFGETCCVHPWLCDPAGVLPSECPGLVLLSSENCDENCFTVPLAQFEADFGSIADAVMRCWPKNPRTVRCGCFLRRMTRKIPI